MDFFKDKAAGCGDTQTAVNSKSQAYFNRFLTFLKVLIVDFGQHEILLPEVATMLIHHFGLEAV